MLQILFPHISFPYMSTAELRRFFYSNVNIGLLMYHRAIRFNMLAVTFSQFPTLQIFFKEKGSKFKQSSSICSSNYQNDNPVIQENERQ